MRSDAATAAAAVAAAAFTNSARRRGLDSAILPLRGLEVRSPNATGPQGSSFCRLERGAHFFRGASLWRRLEASCIPWLTSLSQSSKPTT